MAREKRIPCDNGQKSRCRNTSWLFPLHQPEVEVEHLRIIRVHHPEMDAVVLPFPYLGDDGRTRIQRLGNAGFEAGQPLRLAGKQRADDVAARHTGGADRVQNRLLVAVFLCVFPVNVLGMIVAGEAVDQRLVERHPLRNAEIRRPLRDLDDILRRLRAAETAVEQRAISETGKSWY